MPDESLQPFYTPVSGQPQNPPAQSATSAPVSSSPVASAPPTGTDNPARTPHFSETAAKDPLIGQFTLLYTSSLTNAKAGNTDQARAQYSEMLKIYNQIAGRPDLHEMNKDIAHFCLQDVYDTLVKTSDPAVARLRFGALMGVTIALIIIGALIAINPSIVGLVTGLTITSAPAPTWIGGEPSILITGPTTIHAASLFSTTDHAPLTFLTSSSGTVDAIVSGEYVTLVPKYGATGTARITLIAARQDDPTVMTKQGVDVTVT